MRDVVGDVISGEDGRKVVVVVGVDGDNSLTKDNREGEANPFSISSPAARTREFDQAATKPPLLPLAVGLSDSNRTVNYDIISCGQI